MRANEKELKPCPFCNKRLTKKTNEYGGVEYVHLNKSLDVCLLGTFVVFPDEVDLWNQRAEIETGVTSHNTQSEPCSWSSNCKNTANSAICQGMPKCYE